MRAIVALVLLLGAHLGRAGVLDLEQLRAVNDSNSPSFAFASLTGTIPTEIGRELSTAITRLRLDMNALRGAMPTEMGLLSSLKLLNASANAFSSLPTEIGELASLTSLHLYYNELEELPTEIGRLHSMRYISVYDNALKSSTLPTEIGTLAALTNAQFSYSGVGGTLPTELSGLSAARELYISSCSLAGDLPTEVGGMPSLAYFSVDKNSIGGTLPTELGALGDKLYYAALSGNSFDGQVPTEIALTSKLTALYLEENRLGGTLPSELGALADLVTFNISTNDFGATIPTELGKMHSIHTIYLYSNSLSGAIPTELGRLWDTHYFSLFDNALTGPVVTELGQMHKLYYFHLGVNSLSGTVPTEVGTMSSLTFLSLKDNLFDGPVPGAWACAPGYELGFGACQKCKKGYFSDRWTKESCTPCTHTRPFSATLFEGSSSEAACTVCAAGYLWDGQTGLCKQCQRAMRCTEPGVSLETVVLDAGHWRARALSSDVHRCEPEDACLEGGVCAPCRSGPACSVATGVLGDDGETCYGCTAAAHGGSGGLSGSIIKAVALLVVVVLVVALLAMAARRALAILLASSAWVSLTVGGRMLLAFVQVVVLLEHIFHAENVPLPAQFARIAELFWPFKFDLMALLSEHVCVRLSYRQLLLSYTLAPLSVLFASVPLAVVQAFAARRDEGALVGESSAAIASFLALHASSPVLYVGYLLLPSASYALFGYWSCMSFDSTDAHAPSYMVVDMRVECGGAEHLAIRPFVICMSVVYGLLLPGTLLTMLRSEAGREGLGALVVGTRPSHRWWEALECWRKVSICALPPITSVFLDVRLSRSTTSSMWLIIASAVQLAFTLAYVYQKPLESAANHLVGLLAHAGLVLVMVVALAATLNAETHTLALLAGIDEAEARYSADPLGRLMVATTVFVMVGGAAVWSSERLREQSLQIIRDRIDGRQIVAATSVRRPAVRRHAQGESVSAQKAPSLEDGARALCARAAGRKPDKRQGPAAVFPWYSVFVSHRWRTGQDQARALKQLLTAHFRDLRVFLDVDDLVDISRLEEIVDSSELVLVFISGGYFQSPNCVRELVQMKRQRKPMVVVFEATGMHGGGSLATMRAECEAADDPEVRELAPILFDETRAIRYFREKDFLSMSLMELCEQMREIGVLQPYRERVEGKPTLRLGSNTAQRSADVKSEAGLRLFEHLRKGALSFASVVPSQAAGGAPARGAAASEAIALGPGAHEFAVTLGAKPPAEDDGDLLAPAPPLGSPPPPSLYAGLLLLRADTFGHGVVLGGSSSARKATLRAAARAALHARDVAACACIVPRHAIPPAALDGAVHPIAHFGVDPHEASVLAGGRAGTTLAQLSASPGAAASQELAHGEVVLVWWPRDPQLETIMLRIAATRPVVVVHLDDETADASDFGSVKRTAPLSLRTTPDVSTNLFGELAIPWRAGVHTAVSARLLCDALAADLTRRQSLSRSRLLRLQS